MPSGYPMITKERTQKLDLLQHLVNNIARPIIVCGPEGVGKTRLLKLLQETDMESWLVCPIKGDSRFKFEDLQEQISQTIADRMPEAKSKSLANVFEKLAEHDKKFVLIIDDAGQLVPGLIERIICYANERPIVRSVFVLTHSELYLKNNTDPSVEDCYQIELPPLTEKQCGEFLEYLSTLPKPRVHFNAINEASVSALFLETHGIPGKVLAQLPKAEDLLRKDYSKTALVLAVIALVGVAFGVQWWSSRQPTLQENREIANKNAQLDDKQARQIAAKSKVENAEAKQQGTSPQPVPAPKSSQSNAAVVAAVNADKSIKSAALSNPTLPNNDTTRDEGNISPAVTADNPMQLQTASATADPGQQLTTTVSAGEGERWIAAQSSENYTLQLMALSNEQPIIEVIQQNEVLGQNLRYLKTKTKTGKDRFVLVYGSFADLEQANAEKASLPKALQKTWVRKIGAIQKEMDNTMTIGVPLAE